VKISEDGGQGVLEILVENFVFEQKN